MTIHRALSASHVARTPLESVHARQGVSSVQSHAVIGLMIHSRRVWTVTCIMLLACGCSSSQAAPTPTESPTGDLQPTLTPSPAPVLGAPTQPLPPSIPVTPPPTPTPTPAPTATPTPVQREVVPVQFAPGQIQATFEIRQGEAKRFVLHALAGQII